MKLGTVQDMVRDREACLSAAHGLAELETTWQLNNNIQNVSWEMITFIPGYKFQKVLIENWSFDLNQDQNFSTKFFFS